MNAFPWIIYAIFVVTGLIGTLCVLPYAFAMNPDTVKKLKEFKEAPAGTTGGAGKNSKLNDLLRRLPIPVILGISALQSTLLVAVTALLGMLAARQVGLQTPILQALLNGRPVADDLRALLPATLILGLISGVLIMGLEITYFMPRIPRKLAVQDGIMAFWKRVLACFYGGFVEEILLRLFMMSALAWLIGLLWHTPAGLPTPGAFWLANILAAILFGAGHLPATAAIVKLSPMVIGRALLLNGIPGVACGYLYMRYGLEAAMLCHFSLDIVIHLMAPPFLKKRAELLPPEPAVQMA